VSQRHTHSSSSSSSGNSFKNSSCTCRCNLQLVAWQNPTTAAQSSYARSCPPGLRPSCSIHACDTCSMLCCCCVLPTAMRHTGQEAQGL
jgi:hypothetical protein